ncbi:hypothetical protein PXH59_00225 (plasmid) [Xenorhabdus sp. SF857]|uniref:defense against restriction DarA-related protein n=1 Tax=Xenorhabdus bakwenae TaxID=3026967 RepID=UPI0025581E6A|nr:hypothetical protein [Xenorhabdus sp. SF857]WFQ78108.1 hypothetical protein PXH59_00225 [Xenorhabdus sp. SF857]
MNPIQGLKIFAMPDPLAKGFTRSQLNEVIYQLTADPEQSCLMMEAESLSILDAAYIEGEPVTHLDGFILDAVTTSYARFPRVIQALERALNRFLSGNGITVIENEIGEPKKNNLFATIAAQFNLSDGQAITVVFHAPDEDPKIFKPDDVVIAFRWLLNKRDITQAVAPEMDKGKVREVSLPTIGKRISHLVAANSETFQAKQKEVIESRERLATLQEQSKTLIDELNKVTTEVAILEERNNELDHIVSKKSSELTFRQNYNNELREKIARLKAIKPDEPLDTKPQPEENTAKERLALIAPALFNNILSSMSTIAAIDRGEERGLTRSLFVNSIVNKLKTRHNNGQYEIVDTSLDFIKNVQKDLDKPIITSRNSVWSLHSNAAGSLEEKNETALPTDHQEMEDNEVIGNYKPKAALTLEDIVNGLHDNVAADNVLKMIEESSEELEELGLVEEFDSLIGSAVEKYVELDEKQE